MLAAFMSTSKNVSGEAPSIPSCANSVGFHPLQFNALATEHHEAISRCTLQGLRCRPDFS